VVDEDRVIHGRLTDDILAEAEADQRIEEVMELGPATIRPWASPASALDRMDDSGIASILVTTEFGELLGWLYRSDLEARVETEPN
jgi:Mg/Co/Ni transporter MgtE